MKRLIAIFFVLALLPFTAHAAAPNPDVNTVFASETQLTVYVDNEWSDTLSGSYGFGDTATLNAPTIDGKVFSHWEADGSIVSYSNPLKLTMNAHTTLYAIYADTAPTTKSVTGFTSITRTNDGSKISFQAIADGTVTNAGVVYSTVTFGDELKIGGSSVTNVEAKKITDSTTTLPKSVLDDNNNWMVQITPDNEDTVYYARAYAISGSATTYGDVKEVKPSELESGISLIANLEGFDHTTSLSTLLASLMSTMHTVTYEANGGIGATIVQAFSGSSVTLKINTFTREWYTFTGWNTQANGKGTSYQDGASVTLTENTTLYAQWRPIQYAISYALNGGTLSTSNPVSYDVESADVKLNNPSKTGYTFAGWTGTGIIEASTDVRIPTGSTGNREYTATWTVVEYAISYTLNNGSVSGNPDKYTIESEAITLTNPSRNGYQFAGWTGTYLSGKTQTVTIPTGSTGDRSYTANFSPIVYTISYALNGGRLSGVNPASYTIESVDITLNNPTKTGYTFEGWTGTGLTGATKAVTIAGHSTGNRSYTANWTLIQYDISFDLGGGIFPDENPTSYNYETETFKLNNPTREGYEFVGWNLDGEDTILPEVEIEQGSTANRKYMANWKAIEYTLSYELNGGTVSPDNPVKYTIESEDITLTNPTKDGYEFTGWSGTGVDVTMSKDVIIPTGSTGNREYVANWTGNVLPESPDILRSIIVEISGDETLTTNAGTSASTTFTANVKGTYSRGQTRVLSSSSYVLTWTMDNVEGLSFTDGTLTVNESAMAGTHEVEITATAVSGDIRGTDTKTVTVTVIEVAPVQTAPVLTCATPSITVKKGGTIASLTVRADVTSLEWLCSGELPEGLTYRTDGNKFVISGTVSSNAEARDYVYTVLARNEAGTSDAMMITITVSGTGSGTPSAVQVPAEEISNMTDEEIAETIGSKTEVELTGNVENLSETIGRLETLTDVKTLDLSQVTGVSELKLEQTTLESITLEGNQSIKKVEITGNETLTTLNLAGSKVETVDVQGCKNLTEVNVEGAENLTALNVSETAITALNVKDCANLKMVDAKGCSNLEEVDLEGCESLEYLDVSETAITELNVQDCVNLGTLYCASCGIKDLNLEGCENLNDLDCSNNSLLILNALGFKNLRYLECRHQRAVKPLAMVINFIDLLFGRGSFGASAADESEDEEMTSYSVNVKNLKAYDEAGNEITVEYDPATGEAKLSATPSKITYDYDTGFEGVLMDVEVTASGDTYEPHGVGASGSGCTSGLGIGALATLMMLLVPTSKMKVMK